MRRGNKGISICTFASINGEFQIGAGSSEAAEDSLWLRDKMKTICRCVNEKLTRRRQVTGASRTRRSRPTPPPLPLLSLVGCFFFSFGRNPTIRLTSIAQALDLFPRQDNNEKKKSLGNIVTKKTLSAELFFLPLRTFGRLNHRLIGCGTVQEHTVTVAGRRSKAEVTCRSADGAREPVR